VDHGNRLASYDTSLVVSGGRRRRNVYYNKRQRYAKDNRTAHLTARNDKSVAYVTSYKRLYSTFWTVEARLTTDRHEASRGLFATAELLVPYETRCHGNIPTGTTLTGASNARGYEKITIFDHYLALSQK